MPTVWMMIYEPALVGRSVGRDPTRTPQPPVLIVTISTCPPSHKKIFRHRRDDCETRAPGRLGADMRHGFGAAGVVLGPHRLE
jgi:hypothetical protein